MSNTSEFSFLSPSQHWQSLQHPLLKRKQIELWLCNVTTDLGAVSGNKCLKLKHHLSQVIKQQKQGVVTFGGAFSNHLCAVAACCNQLGLQSVAYVRTDTLDLSNPTLKFCIAQNMQLIAIDRDAYRQRNTEAFTMFIASTHPDLMLVPEGGSSELGAQGVAELDLATTPAGPADILVSAVASGGTLAGMINRNAAPVLGVAVVKDPSLPERVQNFLHNASDCHPWQITMQFTAGGYARFNSDLLNFCRRLAVQQVYVEPIYTGKALFGLFKYIEQDQIKADSRISFFHTGGLQGLHGLHFRKLISAADLAQLSGSTAG